MKSEEHRDNFCIVSPDEGGSDRAFRLAQRLGMNWTMIKKARDHLNAPKALAISRSVENKICYIVDDIIDTGGTLLEATHMLVQKGARKFTLL